jgi:aldehyde dehydrogenase (NAD+)
VANSFPFLLGKSEVRLEPKGVCLIMAPWNYPFNLAISPLIAAIAAGNTVTIKPSEYTPHTSAYIRSLVARVFKPEEVYVVEGGIETAQALLSLPFHHIFFTGSTAVGKLVMKAAAQHLSGLTLELGGKSPAIIDESADLMDTARKLVWGKLLNAGQTCIAPDYVLVNNDMIPALVEKIKVALSEMQPTQGDVAAIVSKRHFERMKALLADAQAKGAQVEIEGTTDEVALRFAPVVLSKVTDDMLLMQEEIFGPLLPIIGFQHSNEAIAYINAHDKPLALYIFSKNNYKTNQILQETSAGGTCVNDVVVHITNPNLPFGGVNHSGMGHYHGFAGFKTFSHERSVFHQFTGFGLNVNRLLYPPYDQKKEKLIKWLMKLIK